MRLKGKTALVTGSTSGIGLGIAKAFAADGANIIINGFGEADAIETERKGLEAISGGKAAYDGADLTKPEQIEGMFAQAEKDFGGVDILVNNAGMQFRSPLQDFPADKFELLMATNVTSVFTVGRAVARHMIRRGRGKIINICSLMSSLARPSIAPYAASKAAVANLTRGMATDWAKHGLNVNGIAPGYIRTELNEALLKDAEFNAWVEKRTPMGRWAEPAELGGAAIFLASDASSFVNGHILYVDGAFTATV